MKMLQIVLDQKGQEWNVIQIENSSPLSSSLTLSSKIHIYNAKQQQQQTISSF